MKKRLAILLLSFLGMGNVLAGSGNLFNVTAGYNFTALPSLELTINTNIPNWKYEAAGIKILSSKYSLTGSGCTPSSNGYCLFSVSNTCEANISVNVPMLPIIHAPAPNDPFQIVLCLNAAGNVLNCEYHTINAPMPS